LFQLYASLLWYDPESDGYQAAFRYYITRHGRWLSPDPLGGDITNPQSLNLYAYVLNNPTSVTDPLGLQQLGCPQGYPTQWCYGGVPGFFAGGIPTTGMTFSPPTWDEFQALETAVAPTMLVVFSVENDEGGPQWGPDDPNFANEFGGFLVYGNISLFDMIWLLGPTSSHVGMPTRSRCVGGTRAMAGNPNLVGDQGGVPGTTVTPGSTAAIPSQWGGITPLSLFSGQIVGLVAVPKLGGFVAFKGVTDTVGSSDVPNVQSYLQNRFPGDLILELNNLPKAYDPMVTGGIVSVPQPMGCPAGTTPF
jgi:RHS repeat-associated protein